MYTLAYFVHIRLYSRNLKVLRRSIKRRFGRRCVILSGPRSGSFGRQPIVWGSIYFVDVPKFLSDVDLDLAFVSSELFFNANISFGAESVLASNGRLPLAVARRDRG